MNKFMVAAFALCFSLSSFAGGGSPAPEPEVPNPPTAVRADFQVMAYNVQMLPNIATTFIGDWDDASRLARIPTAILNMNTQPDAIIFSEAFTDTAYDTLKSELGDIYPFATPVIGKTCSGGGWNGAAGGNCSSSPFVVRGGVFIVSKWPIEAKYQYVYSASQSGTSDYNSNKGAAYAVINKGGFNYHIFGTHLQADEKDFNVSHNTRMSQLSELKNWINGHGISNNEPVIIGGDLNVEYSKASHVNSMLSNSASSLSYTPSGVGSFSAADNMMARANAYYYEYDQNYNDTLDYIITSNSYLQPSVPAAMSVIRLKGADSWYWSYMTNLVASGLHNDLADHYPVIADFKY
jgi:phospholipase C